MFQIAVYASLSWRRALLAPLVGTGLALGLAACQPDTQMSAVSAEQGKPIHRYDRLQSVAHNTDTQVAVGAFGVVLTSTDGGQHWRRSELPGAPGLIKVAACGNGSFAALDFNGGLWSSDGKAEAWTSATIPADDALLDLTCTADGHLWVVGARGAILSSADGGKSWVPKSLDEDIQLLNVQFPTPSFGVIAGEFGRVLVSLDGGGKWTEAGSLGPDFYPQAMYFQDDKTGIVVGLGGAVLETADGGKTWSRSKAPTEAPLYGVLSDPAGVLVVGAVGTAFHRAGGHWQPVKGLPMTDLRGLSLTASQILVAGGGSITALPGSTLSGAN